MNDTTAATAPATNGESQQALAPLPAELTIAEHTIAIEERKFALAQRQAKVYADSQLVPQHYRGKIGNVLIAQNMAKRMGADLLMVMQNLYVVNGHPGWSSQFLIGTFNSNGRFSAIKYRFKGNADTPDEWGCQAYCTEISTNEEISGTWVTWQMAVAEGWVNKSGSKWQTMAEQMFRYRSAAFMIRATAPEIAMGLLTKEELEDMGDQNGNSIAEQTRNRIDSLRDQLSPAADAEAEVIEAEPVTTDVAEPLTSETASDEPGPEVEKAAKPSRAESQKADHIAWIRAFELESDENAEAVAKAVDGARLDDLSPGQVKDIYIGLQPKG